jgi:hypothetical protein
LLGVLHSKSDSILQGNNVPDAAASNMDGVFGEIHVFLQLSWVDLFGANRAYLHLETPKLEEVFLSKLALLSQETMC